MKLSDLLETVREEPPAARYTVDDVVAAGRRRKRRRNTGWAIAALLAVFAAVGVPQLVSRPSVPPVTPPKAGLLDLIFSGYVSGDLRVGDPEWVGTENQTASIGREASPGVYRSVGKLAIYHHERITQMSWLPEATGPVEPINGHEAFFFELPKMANITADKVLTWKYPDGSVGVVVSYENRLSRTEMVRLATAFRVTSPRPVRLPFAISWVPPGMRLGAVEVGRPEAATAILIPGGEGARFEIDPGYEQPKVVSSWSDPAPDPARQPVDPAVPRTSPGNAPVPSGGIVIGVQLGIAPGTGPTPKCEPFPRQNHVTECAAAPGGTGNLVARASRDVPAADLRRVAAAGRIVGVTGNPGTWLNLRESFPTSAEVRRD